MKENQTETKRMALTESKSITVIAIRINSNKKKFTGIAKSQRWKLNIV